MAKVSRLPSGVGWRGIRGAWLGRGGPARGGWERERGWSGRRGGKDSADRRAGRASSKLCRLVYPDILFGLYSPEELSDERGQ